VAVLARLRRVDLVPAKSLVLAAVVAAGALAFGLAQTSPGHSLLQAAGIYEQPANYTSLSFANPQSLPTQLSRSATSMKMSFTISNASAESRTYRWSVVLDRSGHTYDLAAGTTGVPAKGQTAVSRTVQASCTGGQARVTVELAAPAESIYFLTTCAS
jgi:hypothetical protein